MADLPPDSTLTDDYARAPRYAQATGPRETAAVVEGKSASGQSRYLPRSTAATGTTTPTWMR